MIEIRGITDVEAWFKTRNAPTQKPNTKVDVVRLSMNVQKNFMKD